MALILGSYDSIKGEHSLLDEESKLRVATIKIFVSDADEFMEVGDRLFPSEWTARVQWVKEDSI